MNTRNLLVSALILIGVLLSACAPAAPTIHSVKPTTVLPTAIMPTVTVAPTLTMFTSKVFELPMTLSFEQRDWHVSDDFTDLVTMDSSQGNWGVSFNLVSDAELADPTNEQLIPFPEDFVSWIQSNPDFQVEQPIKVTVGGIDGIQVDATPVWQSTTTNKKQFLALRFENWNIVTSPERWRFIYLNDVNGKQLLIMLIAAADQFNLATEQAQNILNTVEFTGCVLPACAPAAPAQPIEHDIPTANAWAGGITAGPDGAVWFVETGANKIGRISEEGQITEYPVPTPHAIDGEQGFIAVGPDGALWFNEDLAKKLGRITMDGQITEYELPNEVWPLRAFVAAPDGTLWATSQGINGIVKLSLDGQVLAQYPVPTPYSGIAGMTLGPDAALWFVESRANQVGRLTLDGSMTEYPLPDPNSFPLRITVGPDRALWFTMFKASKIGRISTDGEMSFFAAGMTPVGIAAGNDGAIWFTGYSSGAVGRLTIDGNPSQVKIQTPGGTPYHITMGKESLLFTEIYGNKIGQIQMSSP